MIAIRLNYNLLFNVLKIYICLDTKKYIDILKNIECIENLIEILKVPKVLKILKNKFVIKIN